MLIPLCVLVPALLANGQNVNTTCKADQFQCLNDRCIPVTWKCDNDEDCTDGSDELNCQRANCTDRQFRCSNGQCISINWKCDGEEDCADDSDEIACPTGSTSKPTCSSRQFQCKMSRECIHQSWVCDGDDDCLDRSDEVCAVTCKADQFQCPAEGLCVSLHAKCNGSNECPDGYDELDCVCTVDQFDCGDQCISRDLVCDGRNDCWNNTDETMCQYNPCKINNGGCSQVCVNLFANTSRCECNPGFTFMEGSTTVCQDIDECKDNSIHGACSQTCINTEGSYRCECIDNYTLLNHTYCKANEGDTVLLVTTRTSLLLLQFDSSHVTVLENSSVRTAIAVDFDYKANTIYWSDVGFARISSLKVNVSSSVEVVVADLHTPDGLAVDWINKHIYFTDAGSDKIEVASVDGKIRKTLIDTGLDEPRAIALDPNNGYLYWTDWGQYPKIGRCGLNGDNREDIVQTNLSWPNGLTIDYVANRLYWVDAKLHTIESASTDGTQRVIVLSSHVHLRHPFAIAVFEDFLYWTDWTHNSVKKFNKFGRGVISSVQLHNPMDIQVYHPYRQLEIRKLCGDNNGGCSHFCLPKPLKNVTDYTPGSKHYTCACSDGFRLLRDGRTCSKGDTTAVPSSSTSSSVVPTTPYSPSFSQTVYNVTSSTGASLPSAPTNISLTSSATLPSSPTRATSSSTTVLSSTIRTSSTQSYTTAAVITSTEKYSTTSTGKSSTTSTGKYSTTSTGKYSTTYTRKTLRSSSASTSSTKPSLLSSTVHPYSRTPYITDFTTHTPEVIYSPPFHQLSPFTTALLVVGLLVLVLLLLAVMGFLVYRIMKRKRTGSATITYQNNQTAAELSPQPGSPDDTRMYDSETVNMEVNLINN